GAVVNEYGMPFTRLTSSANRSLSARHYSTSPSGAKTLLRSEYVKYEYDDNTQCFQISKKVVPGCLDANQRPSSSQTVYHDDGDRTSSSDQSDFDGFGQYRNTI